MMHDVHQYIIAVAGVGLYFVYMCCIHLGWRFVNSFSKKAQSGRPNWLIYMLCHARLTRHSHWHEMPLDRRQLKGVCRQDIQWGAKWKGRVEAVGVWERVRWRRNGGVSGSRIKYQFRLSVRLFLCPLSFIRQLQSHQNCQQFPLL